MRRQLPGVLAQALGGQRQWGRGPVGLWQGQGYAQGQQHGGQRRAGRAGHCSVRRRCTRARPGAGARRGQGHARQLLEATGFGNRRYEQGRLGRCQLAAVAHGQGQPDTLCQRHLDQGKGVLEAAAGVKRMRSSNQPAVAWLQARLTTLLLPLAATPLDLLLPPAATSHNPVAATHCNT